MTTHARRISASVIEASRRYWNIHTLSVLDGALSPRALGLVIEWAAQHQPELRANWAQARRHAVLNPIPPLE